MSRLVPLQPKIHLGLGPRKHHEYSVIGNMQPLQKTTRILLKLQFIIRTPNINNPATTVHYFWNVAGKSLGIDEKSNPSKI